MESGIELYAIFNHVGFGQMLFVKVRPESFWFYPDKGHLVWVEEPVDRLAWRDKPPVTDSFLASTFIEKKKKINFVIV